jgi:hypothetical protein
MGKPQSLCVSSAGTARTDPQHCLGVHYGLPTDSDEDGGMLFTQYAEVVDPHLAFACANGDTRQMIIALVVS